MFLYKIELNKNYFKLKGVEEYDIYRSAIIVAPTSKEVRDIAFENFKGAEIHYDFSKQKSVFNRNNNIWKNTKYTSVKKIGTPIKKYNKKQIINVDFNAG